MSPRSAGELEAMEKMLAGAKEGSRELDALVAVASGDAVCGNPKNPEFVRYRDEDTGEPNDLYSRAAPYTTSLDAALALVSRVLPSGWTRLDVWDTEDVKQATASILTKTTPAFATAARAETLPLALCLALVRALARPEAEER